MPTLKTYRIRRDTGEHLSLTGTPTRPTWTHNDRETCEFESENRAAAVKSIMAVLARTLDFDQTAILLHSCRVVRHETDHAEGTATWDACQRLRHTADWSLPLFIEGGPVHLMRRGEEVGA